MMELNDAFKTSLKFVAGLLFTGLLIIVFSKNHRLYSPDSFNAKDKEAKENPAESKGMMKYFFNARKNPFTNKLDYPGMLAAANADKAMSKKHDTHSSITLPPFAWNSVGPTNTGGETKAILIDNMDPTGQTIFAGGITGGIWKSTNGGTTWGNTIPEISFSQDETMANMNVCCIAQDSKGAIYVGTGDGFTYPEPEFCGGIIGGGIFKSSDDGNTWRLLPSTIPTLSNDPSVNWAYTNRIAINPTNPLIIYAGTGNVTTNGGGLYFSQDSGATWRVCWSNLGKKLTASTLDVKISNDGSVVIADVGGYGYICYPQSGPDSVFTEIPITGAGHLPGAASRIEFAISPTDPNRIYASDINNSGEFGTTAGASSGIFMTETAKTNGGYWYEIGPGGSNAFDPYLAGGFDQCDYDNTMAVFPNDEGYLLLGGYNLWVWQQASPSDTFGSWSEISHATPLYSGDPLYVHPDQQGLVFEQNSDTVYFGCDGGVYKSINATNVETTSGYMTFASSNRNYDVTQFYSVCFSPWVNYYYNSILNPVGLGIGGGAQDNGSLYINGTNSYPNDATEILNGDGGGCFISSINPNIAYFTTYYGILMREGSLSTFSTLTSPWTSTEGNCEGANMDSIANYCSDNDISNFVFPVALYDNYYDTLNHDSVQYISAISYVKGDTIWPNGQNGSYPYVLTKNLPANDTITVPDRLVSRLAVGFDANEGIWINGQASGSSTVVWMPIAGPLSKPTAFTGTSSIHALCWTPDGNALFSGDDGGNVFRFLNINSIIAHNYCSGALWYEQGGAHPTGNTNIKSTKLTVPESTNRVVLSIAADPQDGNKILVTFGGYNGSSLHYVFLSTNALDTLGAPIFIDVTGNLPLMPVYSSILDIKNPDGSWSGNTAMIGTEYGIYTTDNLNGSSTIWVKNNGGMANCLTSAIQQQTLPNWIANNSGDIYAATIGRGLWVSNTNYQAPTAIPSVNMSISKNSLDIYPNPMNNDGNIEFTLASQNDVTITIYNLQGKEVKTITMGTLAPGKHIVPFLTNDMPAGTYFAVLNNGFNLKQTSKFIVIK